MGGFHSCCDAPQSDLSTFISFYFSDQGYEIVEVPLRGKHAAMLLLRPHRKSGLDDVIASFRSDLSDLYDVIDNKLEPKQVNLVMPPFSFTDEMDMTEILQNMGVRQVFTPLADLSGMLKPRDLPSDLDTQGDQDQGHCLKDQCPNPALKSPAGNDGNQHDSAPSNQPCPAPSNAPGFFVSRIHHKTFVDVDEHGVEAAGATTGDIVLGDPEYPEPEVKVTLDRPFLFLIRGGRTGTLLFQGAVYNPNLS